MHIGLAGSNNGMTLIQRKKVKAILDKLKPEKVYDIGDHDIEMIGRVDLVIVTPRGIKRQLKSGIWYTILYAKKIGCSLYVVFPDGVIKEFHPWSRNL